MTQRETKFQAAPVNSGKKRPTQDDLQQDPPDPDLVTQQANGNLEQGVGEAEGAEDQAHLCFIEVEVVGNRAGCLRNSHSLHVGKDGQPDCQRNNAVPCSACLHLQALGLQ